MVNVSHPMSWFIVATERARQWSAVACLRGRKFCQMIKKRTQKRFDMTVNKIWG